MKTLILALAMALTTSLVSAAPADETVKVCVDVKKDGKDVKDAKTGKTKQSCRTVKKHKKLEGAEAVPEGKKK